ncbi:MAG: nucleoside hydrolase [Chloroflexota bacterium]|nr:nucleoside hydrolase [Chloroflexota bacterium]MDE2961973.1 nucleoside hydrolase [Chloroflexota bacterium]
MPKRVIIDTDPGVDDCAAILLALASPELQVDALTISYGNGSMARCAENARRILAAAGRGDIPIYPGAEGPLIRPPTAGWASHIHGGDALGEVTDSAPPPPADNGPARRAAVEIATRALEAPGEITILALGRMTNVALALRLAPEIAGSLAGVVVMGGAVRVPGNVSPVATANIYEDPEAAEILYDSGVPITQVGLDVCDRCGFADEQFERLRASSAPALRLLVSASAYTQAAYRRLGRLADGEAVRYNDVPAVAAAVDPALMVMQQLPVAVDAGSDLTRGQTVVDWYGLTGREANAGVCLEVDAERLTDMVVRRLVDHPWPA